MITRHKKLVLYFIIVCSVIAESAGAIDDCKKINDNQKFKEIFPFSYKGGPKGLEIVVPLNHKTKKFKIENCEFNWNDARFNEPGARSFKRMTQNTKMSGLQPCTKYRIELKVKNMANKKDLVYENFVMTKPEGNMVLELIAENVTDTAVTFSTRSKSADACFVRYELSVKNDAQEIIYENSTITDKKIALTNLSPSHEYTADLKAFDDKGSKISSNTLSFRTQSNENCNEVDTNLLIDVKNIKSDSAVLKWSSDSPEIIYHIEVLDPSGKSIFNGKFSNHSATINNLKACSDYTARLSTSCATKIATKSFQTLKGKPGGVEDINLNSNHTHSMISWTSSEVNVGCVVNFLVETPKKNYTIDRQKTSLTIPKLPNSMKLPITVKTFWNTSDDAVVKTSEFEHIDFDKFIVENVAEFRLTPTRLQLSWSFRFMEILKEFEISFNGQIFTSDQTLINLEIDACKRNYTISIRCASKGGNFGPNVSYQTNLDDDSVPLSAISDTAFSITQTSEELLIKWIPNAKEAPCIEHYDVILNDQNFKVYEPKTILNEFLPCITYRIQVVPVTERGTRGESTSYEFTTKVVAPKAPSKPEMIKNGNRKFTIATTLSQEDKYCISQSPTFVIFECNGKRVEEKIEGDNATHAVVVPKLKPNSDYKCTAFVRNFEGISEVSEAAEFRTLEDSPQPPSNIDYKLNSDNSLDVTWTPDNSSRSTIYNLHLHLKKISFEQPEDCPDIPQLPKLNTTSTQYSFQDLAAYAEYSLKIFTINGNGRSNASEEILILTNPSKASPVREIDVNFIKFPNSTSAVLTWMPPCFMNGKFSLFMVSVKGSRKGSGIHKETLASQGNEIELRNLRPGYKYEVEVQAKVLKFLEGGDILGEPSKFIFSAPSGVPLEKDLEDWISPIPSSVDPESIEVLLRRRIFISSVGDITGIALLIFLEDCPDLPQPSFGYLTSEHSTDLLPAFQGNLNCSQLYQQTEIIQNRLIHDNEVDSSNLDAYNILYVIGEENCDTKVNSTYCNGPLLPGVEYGLMARVFTADTFRDTQPVYFRTRLDDPLMSPIVIVGGSMSAIILVSILICLCCWCSLRKQKKFKKKKEAAETVDNLLSFTSYCVIDKNPTSRKSNQFDHLL